MTAITWKYLLYAQYPACFLLAVYFFINYLRARKNSAVKSVIWVLLFGISLALAVLFFFLGIQQSYWSLKTMFSLKLASWIGIALVLAASVAHIVHLIDKKHTRKVMEKELQKAAKEKDDALAQARAESEESARIAHEEGRREAKQEAEEARFTKAAEAAGAEAASSELAGAVNSPIELTLEPTEDAQAGASAVLELPEPMYTVSDAPEPGGSETQQ
ncbi:MAG: hypothetical protein J5449_01260 [Oscillospiraceae bacterium]|nr:hypothetical protein [Oscillospiraceae bacterium]